MTESKQITVVDTVKKMEGEFKLALPKHIPSERFTRIAVSAINSNPELLDAKIDRRSLYASVMKAAQDGLVIDGREAALVTFKSKEGVKAQYMPMVAGIMKKMRNSGEISNIGYGIVYRNETIPDANGHRRFEYIKGDSESLRHEPILFEDKGEMVGVYAVVTLKDGAKVREFMDMGQIAKVQAVSRSANSEYGPWKKWFEEMATKSVLRKVSKLCPMSSDLDALFRNEDDSADDEYVAPEHHDAETGEIKPEAPKKRPARDTVKAAMQAQVADTTDADYEEIDSAVVEDEELPI